MRQTHADQWDKTALILLNTLSRTAAIWLHLSRVQDVKGLKVSRLNPSSQ